jgi:DNA polymerase-4
VIADLLKNTGIGDKKVRLLGVTLSGLENRQHQRLQQMDLFESF